MRLGAVGRLWMHRVITALRAVRRPVRVRTTRTVPTRTTPRMLLATGECVTDDDATHDVASCDVPGDSHTRRS